MKKLTNVIAMEMVLEFLNGENTIENLKSEELTELIEKVETIKGQFVKKSSSENKKLTKAQLENEEIKTKLLTAFSQCEEPTTIKDLQATFKEEFEGLSNQKLSALIKQLINDNLVVRHEEKRTAKFSLVK